ncbi:MAG: LPS assembly protein LptD, partial [Verrucomicrobiota bacterium]
LWRGDRVKYTFATEAVEADNFRLGQPPFFASGRTLVGAGSNTVYQSTGGILTTDDLARPGYRIQARSLKLVPGEKLEAVGATVYLGDTPVGYFPRLTRSLERHPNFWSVSPGYRQVYGAFLESTYHWFARTNLEATANLDYRTARGVAGGPGVHYDFGKWGRGDGLAYLIDDDNPFRTARGVPVDEDRHVLRFRHSLTNDSGLAFKGRYEGQNDALARRDFFEWDFRRDPQPRTFAEVSQAWSNWTLDALAQPQVNGFFQTVERMPDLRLTGLRQQLGNTPLYYESESSLAYLRFRSGVAGGTNYAGMRGDTYHQVVLPWTFLGWLNVLPRIGGRYTYYGEPDDLDQVDSGRSRWLANTGAEVNFKASRVWSGVRQRFLDLQGLRHIVVPSVNYVFVPEPDRRPMELPQYDFEYLTPRLLPIEFPDYNSVDAIDSQNALRLSLRNKLQTKRAGEVDEVVHWGLYTDWRLDPRPGQTTFPDLYSDLDLAPRRWLLLNSQIRYGVNEGYFQEANHRLTVEPGGNWAWTLGHRYLRTNPLTYGLGNNLVFNSLYYKLNENWGVRATQWLETRDGVIEEQQYALYRDLRSWTAMLGLRFRDNRVGPDDWSIMLSFQLKALPQFRLNQDREVPERLFSGVPLDDTWMASPRR